MKKWYAILMALCMIFTLAACSGGESESTVEEEKGIEFKNGLNWDLTEVYIVPNDSDGWGSNNYGPMTEDESFFLMPEREFGGSEVVLNIKLVDKDEEAYEVYNVPVKDGDLVYMDLDPDYQFAVYVNGNDKYEGEWIQSGDRDPVEEVEKTDSGIEELLGVWHYDGYADHVYILFYDDATFAEINTRSGEIEVQGTYEANEDGDVVLTGSDGEVFGWFDTYYFKDTNGDPLPEDKLRSFYYDSISFYCDFNGQEYLDILSKLEAPAESRPHFEAMNHYITYDIGSGGEYLRNGACVFTSNGKYYEPMYATVSMEYDSINDTKDVFVEITFTETTYLDVYDYPEFVYTNDFQAGMCVDIFDYYTGYRLPATDTYGDTSRGENYHYYEYESQGHMIQVDHNYSTDWKLDSDGSYVLKVQHFFRMPADYDGIVYGHLPANEDYIGYISGSNDEGDPLPMMDDERAVGALLSRVNVLG